MSVPNIQSLIVKFGTEAVNRYREISKSDADAMPEIFLGGYVAQRLHESLACTVHIERSYLDMATELGIPMSQDLATLMGGLRADVAIYKGGSPSHIVEFKKYAEKNLTSSIIADLEKARKLADSKTISVLLGIVICEIPNSPLQRRITELRSNLGPDLECGAPQQSIDAKWQWCFGCYFWAKNSS